MIIEFISIFWVVINLASLVSKPPDRINAAAILVKNCKIMVKICHNWNPLKLRITFRTYFRIVSMEKSSKNFWHLYFSSWKFSKIHYWANKTVHRIKDKHPWFSSEKWSFSKFLSGQSCHLLSTKVTAREKRSPGLQKKSGKF